MSKDKEPGIAALADSLFDWVKGALESGAAPSAVTYVLAAVATDMGLELGKDPYRVLPVILGAVSDRLKSHAKPANDNEKVAGPEGETPTPQSTIH
jgi:hypothetical protein